MNFGIWLKAASAKVVAAVEVVLTILVVLVVVVVLTAMLVLILMSESRVNKMIIVINCCSYQSRLRFLYLQSIILIER